MTVLIAKHEKDQIILGADTGTFYGNYHKTHLTDHLGRKKIETVNDMTFSSTGTVAEVLNFSLFCQTRKPESADPLSIQRFFVNFGKYLRDEGIKTEAKVDNNYFLVFKDKLFSYAWGATSEIVEGDYATAGAGFKESYMALFLGKTVKQAIELTVKMNIWTSGEAQVVKIAKGNLNKK